jgi:hypothetical protein
MESLVGRTLGQYQIVQELGRGGMAVVYKAYQPSLTRYVAIKVLPPQFSFDHDFVERFVREARGAAMLHHLNIITIHDVAEQDGVHYFVMEYLTGKMLDAVMAETPVTLPRIAHIINQVAGALDHAHSQGLIHRDVKPSNISVDETHNDHVKLMDFGLVRASQDSKLTRAGMIMGTPAYMSPEQAQGEDVDYRTDIYSLGVVLYQMLTGTAPFVRATTAAVLMAHVAQPPPSIIQLNPTVPKSVEAVVFKAMAKDRKQRYQSAGQLAQDLRVAITGQMPEGLALPSAVAPLPSVAPTTQVSAPAAPVPPTTVAPAPRVPPAPAKRKVSPFVVAGLGAAVLVVLCVSGIAIAAALGVLNPRTPTTPPPAATSALPSMTLLAAPNLKAPKDGAEFSPNEVVTLAWEPVAGLSANDAFVVALNCGSPQTATVKETSYVVPSSLRAALAAPYECRWSVEVIGQDGVVRSAPSDTRQFTWAAPTATVPATLEATSTTMSTATLEPTASPKPTLPANTPAPTRPLATPTVACTGGRTWDGTQCVCPADKPEWFNGMCIEKDTGKDREGPPQH